MASGNHLIRIPFLDFEIPTANSPRKSDRGGNPVYLFDADNRQYLNFTGWMPDAWDAAGNFVVTIAWSSAAVTGAVVWAVQWADAKAASSVFNADSGAANYAAAQTVTSTASATSGRLVYATITFTPAQANSPAVGDMIKLRFYRDAAAAADTMLGDAEFHGVFVKQA